MKRKLLVIGIALFTLAVFYMNAKLHFSHDQPLRDAEKETVDMLAEEDMIENDNKEALSNVVEKENTVKDFFTEKIQKAIDILFQQAIHIVAIGDSLTQGVGDETDNGGYVGILEERLNSPGNPSVTFENLGKRGNRTDQLLQRLEDKEIQKEIEQADIILLTIGANDVMQIFQRNITNLSLDKFEEELPGFRVRLQAIYDRITGINEDVNIYFIGFYNPYHHFFPDIDELDEIIVSWNESIDTFTQTEEQATFIPVKDVFDDADFYFLAEDNFHPNYDGYGLFANRITQYLIESEGDLHEERGETNDEN